MIEKDQRPERCAEERTKQSYVCMFRQKVTTVAQMITVEPLAFLYQISKTIVKPALDNLELEKACRVNLSYNGSVCDSILNGSHENYDQENNKIQEALSNMHSWQQPMQSFTPLILVLFFGSFSDRHRLRKPFLLFPILGDIIGLSGCILCVIYMNQWPLEVQGVVQNVVPSLFGSSVVILMYTTAYIADTTSLGDRTMRIGVLQILLSLSGPLGNSFCGNFFLKVGYVGVLGTAVAVLLVALLYGLFFIKEVAKSGEEAPKKCLILDLFNPQHAVDTFTIIIKKKAGISRGYAVATVLMIFLHRGAFEGETNVLYLYTQKVFEWTPVDFSHFLMVNGLVLLVGNIFGVTLYTTIFDMSDLAILFVSVLMKIGTNLLFGLARSPTIFYTGVIVSVLTKMFRVAKKSLATKIVSETDIAKMQSLIGIFEIIAPAISVPIYNVIYIYTLVDYPYSFFFFSIILYTTCCLLIGYMKFQEWRKMRMKNEATANASNYDVNSSECEDKKYECSTQFSTINLHDVQ